MQDKIKHGFSGLDKDEKLDWVARTGSDEPTAFAESMRQFWQDDARLQQTLDGFSENTISNFVLPYGVAPNFLIDGQWYTVPMVIEESSVVAAAAAAAKFWSTRGGFRTTLIDTVKLGQLHLQWKGEPAAFRRLFPELETRMRTEAAYLSASMERRGGGITNIELLDIPAIGPDYFQIRVSFQTCDSMGANYINSVLEQFARTLETHFAEADTPGFAVIMAILSNYTPDCLVRAEVSCSIAELAGVGGKDIDDRTFAERFALAVHIARQDPYRAVTHNKGIFNGVDAVVLATANDFRAVEACGHAYAARDGQYRSLSQCTLSDGVFRFWLDLPLALGTVGGLTKLHPLAKRSLELMGNPDACTLMRIVAATGLAQNFAALRSLTTTGIQHGHMKMHLQNILNHMHASETERAAATAYFADRTVSYNGVRTYLDELRLRATSVEKATS